MLHVLSRYHGILSKPRLNAVSLSKKSLNIYIRDAHWCHTACEQPLSSSSLPVPISLGWDVAISRSCGLHKSGVDPICSVNHLRCQLHWLGIIFSPREVVFVNRTNSRQQICNPFYTMPDFLYQLECVHMGCWFTITYFNPTTRDLLQLAYSRRLNLSRDACLLHTHWQEVHGKKNCCVSWNY